MNLQSIQNYFFDFSFFVAFSFVGFPSIDYRLGFFPFDSANAVKAVVRATQDLKAAIRFFYKDKQTANSYKIDTNRIFIGGSSAGAITALHVAYLDDICKISDYLSTSAITSLGGLEGNSGNSGYSSKIQGVLNGCGALARYSWMEAALQLQVGTFANIEGLMRGW